MKTDAQPNQKMMKQGYQEPMVMPAQPTTGFKRVQADLAFVLLKNNFNGPAYSTDPHLLNQERFDRRFWF